MDFHSAFISFHEFVSDFRLCKPPLNGESFYTLSLFLINPQIFSTKCKYLEIIFLLAEETNANKQHLHIGGLGNQFQNRSSQLWHPDTPVGREGSYADAINVIVEPCPVNQWLFWALSIYIALVHSVCTDLHVTLYLSLNDDRVKKIQMGMNVKKKSFKLKNVCFVFTQSDTFLRHIQRMKVWQ